MGRVALKIYCNDGTTTEDGNGELRPGSLVRGAVEVNLGKKELAITELTINLLGQEYVEFKKTKCAPCCCFYGVGCSFQCTETVKYKDGVNFINDSFLLLENALIPVGGHMFRFEFRLRDDYCPSSYKSDLGGHVLYELSSKLKMSGLLKLDEKETRQLLVAGSLDLLTDYDCNKEVGVEQRKGRKVIQLSLPKQGYLPGESIPFKATMCNGKCASPSAEKVLISLIQEEQLYAKSYGKRGKSKQTVIVSRRWVTPDGGCDMKTGVEWEGSLQIPQNLTITNIGGSQFIELNHCLQLTGFGLECSIPIVIGTMRGSTVKQEGVSNAGFVQDEIR